MRVQAEVVTERLHDDFYQGGNTARQVINICNLMGTGSEVEVRGEVIKDSGFEVGIGNCREKYYIFRGDFIQIIEKGLE